MEHWTITEVHEYWPNADTPCWLLRMRNEEGTFIHHLFPKMTLAAREVEYGITDRKQALDVILHERFTKDVFEPDMANGGDPAIALGLTVPAHMGSHMVKPGQQVGVTCYTAPTIEQGRRAHLARVEHAKQNTGTVAWEDETMMAPILEHEESIETFAYVEHECRNLRTLHANAIAEVVRRLNL